MGLTIPLILISVSLNALAQLFLKKGMTAIGYFNFSYISLLPVLFKVVLNPFIISGIVCYLFSIGIWLMVLSRVEVSFAYPFLSVGYVIVAIMGYIFFNDNLSYYRMAGIVVICIGLIIMSKSG